MHENKKLALYQQKKLRLKFWSAHEFLSKIHPLKNKKKSSNRRTTNSEQKQLTNHQKKRYSQYPKLELRRSSSSDHRTTRPENSRRLRIDSKRAEQPLYIHKSH